MILIQKPESRRLKLLRVDPLCVIHVMKPPKSDVIQYLKLPIPDDCKLIGVNANWAISMFEIMLYHSSFDIVPEGEIPPYVQTYPIEYATYARITRDNDEPVYRECK
jgi:hypothetical protein